MLGTQCQPVSSWCPGFAKLISHFVPLLMLVSFLSFWSALFYVLQGHTQDSRRLHSLAYQLLILIHSDIKLLSNARKANRFIVAYTSKCLVMPVGNTMLCISLKSRLNWKTADKLVISAVMGMLCICNSFSHVLSFAWITMFQNQLSRRKTQMIYSWN